ncbi:hypothetical protein D3C83_219140 [compost metagenome]
MRGGGSFEEMCAGLAADGEVDNPVLVAATSLREWIERGLVAGIQHDAAISS